MFKRLERRQYLSEPRPLIIVNSHMVRGHFQQYHRQQPNGPRPLLHRPFR
jgi:hypothetical protein